MLPPVSFLRPELALLLAIVPALLALYLAYFASRRRALSIFGGPGARLISNSAVRRWSKTLLLLLASTAIVLALTGPQIGLRERAVTQQGVDLVVALDVSQSMAVRDVAPDRLRAAKGLIESLARQLAGGRVGLVLFAGDAVVRYPLTSDPAVLGQVLDNSARGFRLPGGSSLRSGLDSALAALQQEAGGERRRHAVLVISDGEDFASESLDVDGFRQRGVRVFAIGVGTREGGQIPVYDNDGRFLRMLRGTDGQPIISRLHEETLRAIAEQGGGRYWLHSDELALHDVVNELRTLDTSEIDTERVPDDRFQWFLGAALIALFAECFLNDRRPMPIPAPGPYRERGPGATGRRLRPSGEHAG